MKLLFRLMVLAAGLVCLILYAQVSASTRVVPRGVPIQHDDFTFTVVRVERNSSLERDRYRVLLRIENNAKRVLYRWNDRIAFISDAAGNRYSATSKGAFELPAGKSRSTSVAFDLPFGAARPMLHFWDGVFMGDVFDGLGYARVAVPLY